MQVIRAAQMAIEAWRKGEAAGSYADFKKLLSNKFRLFSHPVLGRYENEEAFKVLGVMMDRQEKLINELVFSNIRFFRNGHTVLVMFDSKGTMMGGRMYYDGSVVICFTFDDDGKILVFKLFAGTINKDWFNGDKT